MTVLRAIEGEKEARLLALSRTDGEKWGKRFDAVLYFISLRCESLLFADSLFGVPA